MKIIGYADPLSIKPGGTIEFKVSTEEPHFDASVVRIVGGPTPGVDAATIPCPIPGLGRFPGRKQFTHIGSYADLPLPQAAPLPDAVTVQSWICPTTAAIDRRQTIIGTDAGLELYLETGHLVLSYEGHLCSTKGTIENHAWYRIVIQWSSSKLSLVVERISGWAAARLNEFVDCSITSSPSRGLRTLRLAASATAPVSNHYNGKVEGLSVYPGSLALEQIQAARSTSDSLAHWSFERDMTTDRVVDIGPHGSHGRVFNLPTRAVTGHNWNGDILKFTEDPSQYGAISFHDDDLYDSGWETDVRLQIPNDLASGIYALEVSCEGGKDAIPFFVQGAAKTDNAVLFLAPTSTYLAYGNEHLAEFDLSAVMQHKMELSDSDRFILSSPFIGKSLYDHHTDGSAIAYSSRLRPILNFRPNYRTWLNAGPRHFAADLLTIGWLEKRGVGYDVAIDEDLDVEGETLLDRYKVLVTGTHPEYWSETALKAVHAWLARGGRLIYLGANGFYWVTGFVAQRNAIEVRRGTSATRTADTPPGEAYLTSTGKSGGIWRHRGYSPQALTGVGFAAQGWGGACGYKRLKASYDGPGAAFFKGIDEEIIGDFGTIMGGAAGDEVDRLDYKFGTPSHALWLATSTGLSDYYQLVHEDLLFTLPGNGGTENPLVRGGHRRLRHRRRRQGVFSGVDQFCRRDGL